MKPHLQSLLREALDRVAAEAGIAPPAATIQVDATRDPRHGDFATNLALSVAKPLGKPAREIAQALLRHLPASDRVARAEIAGPGFINFFLTQGASQSVVAAILAAGEAFGRDASGQRGRVLVEFVSANPTGPLHVGHGRGAAYGDALANVLACAGYTVGREYYVNDAGRQVEVLGLSVWLRYLEACGQPVQLPARGYPGDYLRATAEKLKARSGDTYVKPVPALFAGLPPEPLATEQSTSAEREDIKARQEAHLDALIARAQALLGPDFRKLQQFSLEEQLGAIRATLAAFGVRFDRWYSERELVESGAAQAARDRLQASGHTYEKDGALWFRTTEHGDDKDRVLVRANGAATYFGNDLAYHVDKLARGWQQLIDVWGADHHGLLTRMRAALHALTGRNDALQIPLMQFVTLSAGRMGKRSGNFVTLDELIADTGRDATRFFYLLRSHDQHLEFDIELARSQSNDNPVYYVQYAHARIASVLRQGEERGLPFDAQAGRAALVRLTETHEKDLAARLARYPELIQTAATQLAPHLLTHYLREVADLFHSYYNAHAFLVEDAELRNARLALVSATGQVLRNGLGLLGVSAPERMERSA